MKKCSVLLGCVVPVVMVMAGCAGEIRTASVAATPLATVVVARLEQATVDRPLPVASAAVPLLLRPDLSLTLPDGWHYSMGQAKHGDVPVELQDVLLLAWVDGAAFATSAVRLSVVAVPRNHLSLDDYLDGAVQELNGHGIRVVTTAVTTELRGDGLPAAELIFMIEQDRHEPARGYQVVLLDETGHDLVILSVVAPAERWSTLSQEVDLLVRGVAIASQPRRFRSAQSENSRE